MDHPVIYTTSVSISCTVCFILAVATTYRIYKHSRSVFAFTLVMFTLGDSLTAMIFLISNAKHPENPKLIGFVD